MQRAFFFEDHDNDKDYLVLYRCYKMPRLLPIGARGPFAVAIATEHVRTAVAGKGASTEPQAEELWPLEVMAQVRKKCSTLGLAGRTEQGPIQVEAARARGFRCFRCRFWLHTPVLDCCTVGISLRNLALELEGQLRLPVIQRRFSAEACSGLTIARPETMLHLSCDSTSLPPPPPPHRTL